MQVELLKPHTHAGIPYPAGARIALDEAPARWLIETGVARQPARTHEPKPHPRLEEKTQ